jgi:hypothetical protein
VSESPLRAAIWEADHGDRCDCRLLAEAVGARPSAVDFSYCRRVLQQHWRVRCNHGHRSAQAIMTPPVPPLDVRDPLQAALLANMPVR